MKADCARLMAVFYMWQQARAKRGSEEKLKVVFPAQWR
jgi:hypothetical protein